MTINEATVSVSFCVMFVKNWKSSEAVKPFLLSLFVNPLLLAWREMKQVVFSLISIYHIKGDIEFFWYQFVILKSSRFYYAPLTCFLKFNPKLAICQERLILRFDRTILFYSPSLIFLNVLKKFIKHINMSLVTHISILFDICMSHSYASVHLSCIIWPTFAICIVPMSRPPLYR